MYNRKVGITIVSSNTDLASILLKAALSTELSVFVTTIRSIEQLDTGNTHILICDTTNDIWRELPSGIRPLIVLCLNQQQWSTLAASTAEETADIWLKPYDSRMIIFQLQKLLQGLLLKRQQDTCQNYLNTVIDLIPDLIWFKRLDGLHLKVNNEFCKAVGKPRQEIEGHDHYHIWGIDKEEYENSDYVCLDTDCVILQTKKPGVFDEKVAGSDGFRQLKTYKAPLLDAHGELVGTVGVARDVTEFKNMDAKLELILHTMPFAVVITDINEHILTVNQKFEYFFQMKREDVIGQPCVIQQSDHGASIPPNLLYYEPGKEIHLWVNQAESILEINKEPIWDFFENHAGTLYIFRDVTAERKLQAHLKGIAYTDQLTGLFTRRYLYEYIDNHEADAVTLLYIDFDDFKQINDTYGHLFGDEALKNTGNIIQRLFPSDICVRMGGDEFLVVIIGETDVSLLAKKANQINDAIQARFATPATAQQFTVSIGIATLNGHSQLQLDELLRQSDIALYEAKTRGKRQCIVYTELPENNQ